MLPVALKSPATRAVPTLQTPVSSDDFSQGELDAQIEASIKNTKASGAHGTPTVFINGQFHDNTERMWKIERLREAVHSAT